MKRFALPCLHFCWVFANADSLEFVGKSRLIIPSLNIIFLSFIHSCVLMLYSNRRRHNSPSIPQSPYQTIIIPCPNFDPIYQVILLKNFWVESLPSKKKREQVLKSKRGGTSYEEAQCFKKSGWNLQAAGRDSIQRKKERRSHFPIVQNPICGLIHTHASFASALPLIPWLFPFLPPFTTPFSINHDYLPHKLSRIFLCFYNI
jgi:hypothetical protein